VAGKGLFQGRAVVDDDIVLTKIGLGEMPAIGTAEDYDFVDISLELEFSLVYERFVGHGWIPVQKTVKISNCTWIANSEPTT